MATITLTCACGRKVEVQTGFTSTEGSPHRMAELLRAGGHDPEACSAVAVQRRSAAQGVSEAYYAQAFGSPTAEPPPEASPAARGEARS